MLLALLTLGALQDVLTVDPLVGPYFEIRDAVAAADPGDVIRVAPGNYGYFGAIGKGLTVVPSVPNSLVRVIGTVRVQNLPADQTVVLAGLTIEVPPNDAAPALLVAGTQGAVRVEDSTLQGRFSAAISAVSAADLVLVDCNAQGFYGTALQAQASSIRIHGGVYAAGSAPGLGLTGHAGVHVMGGVLELAGVHVAGGPGGDEKSTLLYCIYAPGYGGDAVLAENTAVEVLDASLVQGAPGTSFYCVPAGPGLPVQLLGTSSIVYHDGDAVRLSAMPRLAVEGAQVTVTAIGEPGHTLALAIGSTAHLTVLPALVGDLLVGGDPGDVRRIALGASPAMVPLTTPLLQPFGVDALHLQAIELRPGGTVLGAPRVVTILDSAW